MRFMGWFLSEVATRRESQGIPRRLTGRRDSPRIRLPSTSGHSSAWSERTVRDREVGGSNPLAPTTFNSNSCRSLDLGDLVMWAVRVLRRKIGGEYGSHPFPHGRDRRALPPSTREAC